MQHPQVFKAWAFMNGLPGFRATRLVGAVVHDSYARVNRIDEGFGVGQVEAMMVDQVNVDCANEIGGTDQGDLLSLCQVAKIEEAKLAKGDEDSCRAGILSGRSEEHTSELQSPMYLVCR